MFVDNVEALRTWLTTSIEPMCEADPQALAKYVIALVKKDRPEKDLKLICLQQLEVFFHKETKGFVEKLFEAIRTKSYLGTSQDAGSKNNSTSPKHVVAPPVNSSVISTQQHSAFKVEKRISPEKDTKPKRNAAHSKSRSRSPVRRRSKSREEEDRRARRHSGEDKRRRHTGTRRHDNNKFRERREFRSGRGRSPSWGRSRSRSWTRSRSRSWSRERSPERPAASKNTENGQAASPHTDMAAGDKDYRPAPRPANDKYKINKRCRDFDERGFCMRGELCPFDHGADPVVVDELSILNFNNTPASQAPAPLQHPIPPIIHQAPVIPPPPPPPPPENYVPEPYNPEAPGMERTQRIPPPAPAPYWVPPTMPPAPPLRIPPPGVYSIPPPPIPAHHPRTRELIGVPTVDVEPFTSNHPPLKPPGEESIMRPKLKVVGSGNRPFMASHVIEGNQFRRKPYHAANRRPFNMDRCTLELRKVPRDLNNITSLNGHFSKFGSIVNIKVGLEDDPEAAMVEFSTHAEALKAYRCTDAVLNNRFIKLFWHNKDNKANHSNPSQEDKKVPPPPPTSDKPQIPTGNVFTKVNNVNPPVSSASDTTTTTEKAAATAGATYRWPVFNKAALKKNNVVPTTAKLKVQTVQAINKMLHDQLSQQKKLLALYKKATSETEKEEIKKLMTSLSAAITKLSKDESKQTPQQQPLPKPLVKQEVLNKTKTQAEKELLDAEMDLYNKQHSGDDASELVKKVKLLREQAKLLGILPAPGRGGHWSRRGFRGRGRGRGAVAIPRSMTHLDRRPKKLVVKGPFKSESLFTQIIQCLEAECTEVSDQEALLTFKTAKDAHQAKLMIANHISQKPDFTVEWFSEALSTKKEQPPAKEPTPNLEAEVTSPTFEDPQDLLLEDDDDEEERNRSWRRWFT